MSLGRDAMLASVSPGENRRALRANKYKKGGKSRSACIAYGSVADSFFDADFLSTHWHKKRLVAAATPAGDDGGCACFFSTTEPHNLRCPLVAS
jgi:hypothetical protein